MAKGQTVAGSAGRAEPTEGREQLPPTPCSEAEVGLALFAGAGCAVTEPDDKLMGAEEATSKSDEGTEYPVAILSLLRKRRKRSRA